MNFILSGSFENHFDIFNSIPFCYRIHLADIIDIVPRRHTLSQIAFEIFVGLGYSFLFIFPSSLIRDIAYKRISDVVMESNCIFFPYHRNVNVEKENENEKIVPILTIDENRVFHHITLEKAVNAWSSGNISNFDYLMILNYASGRTFSDLNQYPIFPWILRNYLSHSLDLKESSSFRDLSLPMGCLTEKRRKRVKLNFENMMEAAKLDVMMNPLNYQQISDTGASDFLSQIGFIHLPQVTKVSNFFSNIFKSNKPQLQSKVSSLQSASSFTFSPQPYHHGSFYSNAGFVLYFLTRIEPFASREKHIHSGRFDVADRIFHSLSDCWKFAAEEVVLDCKELIPEFFCTSAFLRNHLSFGIFGYKTPLYDSLLGHPPKLENKEDKLDSKSVNSQKQRGSVVHDVVMPLWAHKDPERFIFIHRMALESPVVSSQLHKWIDLIFGYKQKGFLLCTYVYIL
jgi:hypothetical protein